MKVFLVLATVLALVCRGSSLKCFGCDSSVDARCADLSGNLHAEQCPSDLQRVDTDEFRKIQEYSTSLNINLPGSPSSQSLNTTVVCQKTVITARGITKTVRMCTPRIPDLIEPCDVIHAVSTAGGITVEHCSLCDSDGCNGSGALAGSYVVLSLTALLGAIRTTSL